MIKKILLLLITFVPSLQASEIFINNETYCLARNIYFEAGNQPLAGRIAVAHVTLNRVNDVQFPNTICAVVYQTKWKINWKGNKVPVLNKCQFSWFCDGKPDKPTDSKTWMESLAVAERTRMNIYPDITENSLWYHADYVRPFWSKYLKQTVRIENHLFYK